MEDKQGISSKAFNGASDDHCPALGDRDVTIEVSSVGVLNNAIDDQYPVGDVETDITLVDTDAGLLYNISDNPPIHLTVLFALQQALLSLSSSLAISFLVADVACAGDNEDIKATLLSSTLIMNGITTFFMITLGIRLLLFQGPAPDYIVPLLVMTSLNPDRCDLTIPDSSRNITFDNSTTNATLLQAANMDLILTNIRAMQGSLIAAGAIHCFIGVTGLVGLLLRFIGPVTIVPTILLTGLYITRATTDFAKVHWGVSATTAMLAIILSLYLANHKTPIPIWTPKKGFRVIRYPLHQVFSILIAMMLGWVMSAVMTSCGVFSDDPKSSDYLARTDARTDILNRAHWFYVPYPGQFGSVSFSVPIFVAFIIATITSIFDSIGDYYACAKMCNVPPLRHIASTEVQL